jgi:hypothetical protein
MHTKRMVAGIASMIVGTLSLLPSLTGFAASEQILRGGISLISFILIIGGILIAFIGIREVKEGGLVGLVLEPHREQRHHRTAEVIQIPEITGEDGNMFIQLDDNPPLDDSRFINLPQTKELLTLMEKEDIEKMSQKYSGEIVREIGLLDIRAYMEHIRTGRDMKDERYFNNARALERFGKILNPGFKSREESIENLKNYGPQAASLIRPIREGKATYVHIAPDHVMDNITQEGLKKERDSSKQVYSFVFESEERAEKFVTGLSPEVDRIAGVRIDRYIMFKTPLVPGIAPQHKAYSAGCRKAMFPYEVPRELMYDVKTGRFTR